MIKFDALPNPEGGEYLQMTDPSTFTRDVSTVGLEKGEQGVSAEAYESNTCTGKLLAAARTTFIIK